MSASGKGRKQTPEQIAKRAASRRSNIVKTYGSMDAFYKKRTQKLKEIV